MRLAGSMSMEARDRMIDAFTNDPAVTVFLMSLKAGGVALNLTAASHVMLLDPWWCAAAACPATSACRRLLLPSSGGVCWIARVLSLRVCVYHRPYLTLTLEQWLHPGTRRWRRRRRTASTAWASTSPSTCLHSP